MVKMVRYMTRSVFKYIVKARNNSEARVLKARVKHAQALFQWKAAYFQRIYSASKAPRTLALFHKRQKDKQKKMQKELMKA